MLGKQKPGVLDRPLERKTGKEVSLSAFAHLFAAIIQQAQSRSARVSELEARLAELGQHVGVRLAELLPQRTRPARRETSVVAMLSFIVSVAWKTLFGRPADNLEKSLESPLEYLLVDTGPNVGQFVSLPKGLETLSVGAFAAGIVRGMLESAGFGVSSVQSHNVDTPTPRTVIVVRFLPATIARDVALQQ